jgi:hypothetical protein
MCLLLHPAVTSGGLSRWAASNSSSSSAPQLWLCCPGLVECSCQLTADRPSLGRSGVWLWGERQEVGQEVFGLQWGEQDEGRVVV